jgi:hypothetical protein
LTRPDLMGAETMRGVTGFEPVASAVGKRIGDRPGLGLCLQSQRMRQEDEP